VIVFDRASVTYPGGVAALREVSLEVAEGELLVLLGTSGSGKTTAMKLVNRLVEPTGGRVLVQGRDVREHDPVALRRSIGYAVQHIGLLPHLSVGENVALVLRLLRRPGPEVARRVDEMLALVGLDPEGYRGRSPSQLSGGEKQRVGVARALAADPKIALMDEPFGALDPITREELQGAFVALRRRLGKTIIFVTHDMFEAVKLADRIALLDRGRLRQVGTPSELVRRPASGFASDFLGPHRFQLVLMTTTLEGLLEILAPRRGPGAAAPEAGPGAGGLRAGSTLLEALEASRRAEGALPLWRGEEYLGAVERERVFAAAAAVLGETGAAA